MRVVLNSIEEKWIPQYEGVYLFHDLRGVYYIGESNNLQRRFDQHKLKKSNMSNSHTVEDNLVSLISKMGEKITIGKNLERG